MNLDMVEKVELIDVLIKLTNKAGFPGFAKCENEWSDYSHTLKEKDKIIWRIGNKFWINRDRNFEAYLAGIRTFSFFEQIYMQYGVTYSSFLDIDPKDSRCCRKHAYFVLKEYINTIHSDKNFWELFAGQAEIDVDCRKLTYRSAQYLPVIWICSDDYPELLDLVELAKKQHSALIKERKNTFLNNIGARSSEEIIGALT